MPKSVILCSYFVKTLVYTRAAVVTSFIAANLCMSTSTLSSMVLTATTSSTAPTPKPLSAGDVHGIVQEVW